MPMHWLVGSHQVRVDGALMGVVGKAITQLEVAVKNGIRRLVVATAVGEEMEAVIRRRPRQFGHVQVVPCGEISQALDRVFE